MVSLRDSLYRQLFAFAAFLPLVVFLSLGDGDAAYRDRFLWGAAAVPLVLLLFVVAHRRPNPLAVAVNIWLCVEAASFLLPFETLAIALDRLRETAFFLAIVVVGASYAALSKQGLLTETHADRKRVRLYSLALLGLAGAGLIWSIPFRGDEMLAAGLPAAVLFLAQTLLNARLRKRAAQP